MGINWRVVGAVGLAVCGLGAAAWQFREQMRPPAKVERAVVAGAKGPGARVDVGGDLPKDPEAKREAIADQLGVKPEQVRLEGEARGDGPPGGGLIEGPFTYEKVGERGVELEGAVREKVSKAIAGQARVSGASEPVARALLAPFRDAAEGEKPGPVVMLRQMLEGAEIDVGKAEVRVLGSTAERPRGVGVMKMAASKEAMEASVLQKPRVEVRAPVRLKSPETKDGEVELTAELVRQADGTWELLSYGFSTATEGTAKELGKAMKAARGAMGGGR